jgi:hypothetical protein
VARTTPDHPLLFEVLVALGAGRVTVGPIHCDDEHLHGYEVSRGRHKGLVRLNPAVELVDTTIHELLHRLRPDWSERTIRARTGKLMATLSNEDIDKIDELVRVSATRRKTPIKVR